MVTLTTLILNGATNLPQVGANLAALSDVVIGGTNTLAMSDVLYYNGTEWENDPSFAQALTSALGYLDPLTRQSNTNAIVAISVGTTAPSSPAVGDLWVDTN